MSKTHVYTDKWTINELYEDYYKQRKLTFNTEYQRSEVWNLEKRQRLIDSIIKEYNIGMVFLRGVDSGVYEVLDGQQRLKTIFRFMEDDNFLTSAELTPEVGEKNYNELKKDSGGYARFIAFKIDIAFVENADDETTADIFLRLQEGMPLNTAEKLNAMRGKMRNTILELSRYPFIKNTKIKDHRFAHRLLAAQIFELEMNSDFDIMNFPDIKFENLREMYEKYSFKEPPTQILANVKKYMNFLDKAFTDKAKIIRRRGDFIPVYLLHSYLDKKYVTSGIGSDFVNFTMEFTIKVESMNTRDTSLSPEEVPYRDFKVWRSAGALSSRSFRERFKIILGKFLEYVPDLKLKDPKRLFDEGQKLAIYYRDKGICQLCKEKVSFGDAEFDHIAPWSKGGPTTVRNGQLLCQECNRTKGTGGKQNDKI